MYRLNLTEIFFAKDRELTINDYEVSAQNYYLNTIKAIELANKIDARFYIVTLFAKADLKNKDEESIENLSVKRKVFFKVIQKILDQNEKANWINLKEYQANEDLSIDKMFCDNIHFTTKGNQTVANILYKYLNWIWYYIFDFILLLIYELHILKFGGESMWNSLAVPATVKSECHPV